MEESANTIIAPFVIKTYHMVNDSSIDSFISWGLSNNTFIVPDPLHFSSTILPAYFKHSNFSSFVRQLNTYGFKKVESDRWEFANQWFLRGQNHLLKNIVRRKHGGGRGCGSEEGDEVEVMNEIVKLKHEHEAMKEAIRGMDERIKATEKRPHQVMAFLSKVVEDPELVPKIITQKDLKKRLCKSTSSSSSSGCSSSSSSSYSWGEGPVVSVKVEVEGGDSWEEMGSGDGGSWRKQLIGQSYAVEMGESRIPQPFPFSMLGGGGL